MDDVTLTVEGLPEGDLVVQTDRVLTGEQRAHFMETLRRELPPGRSVFLLDAGMTLSTAGHLAQLKRIEHKLDTLIASLATEEEDDGAVRSLDGDLFAARDDKRGLG